MHRRALARAAAALGLAVALLLVAAVGLGADDAGTSTATEGGEQGVVGAGRSPAARSTGALQARVERVPGDWSAWAALGSAHLEEARVTGDPSHYPRAEEAFRESLRVQPDDNADALAGLGALAATRHDFAGAVSLGRRAVETDPYDAPAHGVLVDGLVETGQYDEAADVLQRMADLDPGTPALARVSYLRELHGDVVGAREVMERALSSAASTGDVVFALHQLGDLAYGSGDLETAAARYAEGLRRDPSYEPLLVGQARVAAARGNVETAVQTMQRVVDAQPLPTYAAELGDLLAALDRHDEAQQQYAVVDAATRLIEANGGTADLETALIAGDRGDAAGALAAANAEHERRQSVFADDALAWALHVNGRDAEALPLAERALRLGTRSALLHYHLGMIQSALGHREAARASLATALEINPYFSWRHVPVARAELAELAATS
jgi:pentatricopeptide repeat protein